jgi:hypothetical protein
VILDSSNKSSKATGIPECPLLDLLKDLCEVWIKFVGAIVVSMAKIFDIFSQVSEQKDVVLSNFTGDFDLLKLVKISQKLEGYNLHWHHRKYR